MVNKAQELGSYVVKHSKRGQCRCGRCIDGGQEQPSGHTSDVYFFEVAANDYIPDGTELTRLIKEHEGAFNEINLFDGKEHGYIELGGWVGDQGVALQLMGLGEILGLWKLMTPKMLPLPKELQDKLAGMGMVTIQAKGDGA